jgi:dihydroxyacetone kinase-like protein
MRSYAREVERNREHLTELDAAIGDADHGINMHRGMQAVLSKLDELGESAQTSPAGESAQTSPAGEPGGPTQASIGPLLKAVGMTLVSTVGGAGGPLYGTLFLQMGATAGKELELTPTEWASALQAGVRGVKARGRAEPGDKTMIDALEPAAEALEASVASGASLAEALRQSAAAAEQGMKATIPLVARKGRASYLGARSAGHQDPGATSSWLLMKAAVVLAGGKTP